jgi:hypothetical protein
MKTNPMPLKIAIMLLIAGIFLGTIFSFGMQYWNEEVTQEECIKIQTQFLGYKEVWRRGDIQQIAIDCANGKRYFIDGVSINSELQEHLRKIAPNENITLFIHPNSDTIVEFSTKSNTIMIFSETIDKLGKEATAFLFLGFFMYFCSLIGLYYVVWHGIIKRNKKVK